MAINKIIEEFGKVFPEMEYTIIMHGTKEDRKTGYTEPHEYDAREELKDFITKALSSQQAEFKEMVEGMRKKELDMEDIKTGGYVVCECEKILQTREAIFEHKEHLNLFNKYYNQALEDILKQLK